eukprot:729313-Prymnesium_polylepis.1
MDFSEAVAHGFLSKYSVTASFGVSNWQRRYLVLTSGSIRWYKPSGADEQTLESKPRGELRLGPSTATLIKDADPSAGKPWCFSIRVAERKGEVQELMLQASGPEERIAWLAHLSSMLTECVGHSPMLAVTREVSEKLVATADVQAAVEGVSREASVQRASSEKWAASESDRSEGGRATADRVSADRESTDREASLRQPAASVQQQAVTGGLAVERDVAGSDSSAQPTAARPPALSGQASREKAGFLACCMSCLRPPTTGR